MTRPNRKRKMKEFTSALTTFTEKASGMVFLELLDTERCLLSPTRYQLLAKWGAMVESVQPLCLLCDRHWRFSGDGASPAAFSFMSCDGVDNSKAGDVIIVTGICEPCCLEPDIMGRASAAMTKIWPNAQPAAAQ